MSKIEELIVKSQLGDMDAKETLVSENSGLIWAVVRRFLGRGTDADDLYQLGCLGFLKAVEGFNTEYGTQFSTYAVPKIAGEIRRYLRDNGILKISRIMKEQATVIKNARNLLCHTLGREPTISELSEYTGLSAEEISETEIATAAVESIQQPSGEDGFALENVLSDQNTEESLMEQIALRQAVEKLPEKEKLVIRLRYFHALTQQRTAIVLGVSQVQVSRIEKKAIIRLKEILK